MTRFPVGIPVVWVLATVLIIVAFLPFYSMRAVSGDNKGGGEFEIKPGTYNDWKAPCGSEYSIKVPEGYDPKKGAPLLICFHGAGGKHTNFLRSGLAIGSPYKWVIVAPQAPGGQAWDSSDAKKMVELIEDLEKKKGFRFTRKLALGFSSGGHFVYMALNHYKVFDGFCTVSGVIGYSGNAQRKPEARLQAVAIICGEQDGNFEGAKSSYDQLKAAKYQHLKWYPVPNLGHKFSMKDAVDAFKWLDEVTGAPEYAKKDLLAAKGLIEKTEYAEALALLEAIPEKYARYYKAAIWVRAAIAETKKIDKIASGELKGIKKLKSNGDPEWVELYQEFAARFPGTGTLSKFEKEVKRLRKTHEKKAVPLFEEAEKLREEGDYFAALSPYIQVANLYPLSECAESAKSILESLQEDEPLRNEIMEKWRAEFFSVAAEAEKAADAGEKKKAREILEAFIEKYPFTEFAEGAQETIEMLEL